MNKMIAVVAVAGLALVTFGEVAAPVKAAAPTKDGKAKVQLTPEEKAARKAKRKAEFYRQMGGHVKDLRKQKGKVVFVDAQSRAKRAWFADSAAWLGEKTKIVMAVEEGWGANPTNDVEKAIWDEVHALPDKPMQIKFDPKRDK